MAPRDAWNMTMREYTELMTIDKTKPVEVIYDKDTQESIVGNFEVRKLING